MAIERDINKKKKDPNPKPDKSLPPMQPFRKKGLRSPTYGRRNPHKDHGDKKPSLKTKASIIKDKAKKGQGLARGGMVKSIIKLIPGFAPTPKSGTISTIDPVKRAASRFVQRRKQLGGAKALDPVKKADGGSPRSRIQTAEQKKRMEEAKKLFGFTGKRPPQPKIDRSDKTKFYRQRGVAKKAMGGEASESVARSKILKDMRDRKRKRLTDSINRLTRPKGVGKPKIVPKKKPKKK